MNTRRMAQALGRRGGRARARRLLPADRSRIASLGARARLRSFEAERHITANLRYASLVEQLRGGPARIVRVKTFEGPLPGIYPAKS